MLRAGANGGRACRGRQQGLQRGLLLSEVVAQVLEHAGYDVERRFGLGGTLICYEALKHGEIDVYIEYTGTLARAILKLDRRLRLRGTECALASDGVQMLG